MDALAIIESFQNFRGHDQDHSQKGIKKENPPDLFPDCDLEDSVQGKVLGISKACDLGSHEARAVSLATSEGALRIMGPSPRIEELNEQGLSVGAWVRLSQLHAGNRSDGKLSYLIMPLTEVTVLELDLEAL